MTKTRWNWTADFLSDTTNNNHCSPSCMVLFVSATSVFEILFKILYIWCVVVFYVVLCYEHLQIESVFVPQLF